MAQILLEIEEENLQTVLMIIKNLKTGLIQKIDVQEDAVVSSVKQSRYQPKEQKIYKENEQNTLCAQGKYLNPKEFKQKLRKTKKI